MVKVKGESEGVLCYTWNSFNHPMVKVKALWYQRAKEIIGFQPPYGES